MSDSQRYILEKLSQLQAISSPVKQEIIDVIQSRGQCSIGDIADELGRPADGLYYHIRALVKDQLLVEVGFTKKTGQREKIYNTSQSGSLMEAGYDQSDPEKVDAMNKIVSSMLKIALKDFKAGLNSKVAVVEGDGRNLSACRIKSRLTYNEVRRVNSLLAQVAAVFNHQRQENTENLYSIAWVLAPIEARPKRRT